MLFIDPEELQEETEGRPGEAASKSTAPQAQSARTLRILLTVASCGIAGILLMLGLGILSVALGWGPLSALLAIIILWVPLIFGASIWALGAIWATQKLREQRSRPQSFLYSKFYGSNRR